MKRLEHIRITDIPLAATDRPRSQGAEFLALSGALVVLFYCLVLFTAGQARAQETTEVPDSPPLESVAEAAASPQPDEPAPEASSAPQMEQEPRPTTESLPADDTQEDPAVPGPATEDTQPVASPAL